MTEVEDPYAGMTLSQRIAAKKAAGGAAKAGKVATGGVAGAAAGAQHQDLYRKLLLRKRMMGEAVPGPAYVPFIGEGDIAAELYAERFTIYGADLDPERAATAQSRLGSPHVVLAGDCDGWPLETLPDRPFTFADFDSYSYPYNSYRSFFEHAPTADRMVLAFTDGMRMGILRSTAKQWHHPDGSMRDKGTTQQKRYQWSRYWAKSLLPWFREDIAAKGYDVVRTSFYLRGAGLLYWACVIQRHDTS